MTAARIALVTVTCPDLATAEAIGRRLVDERLAACCNAAACRSVYRWQGAVESGDEALAALKTLPERVDALVARIAQLHPYTLPAIEWAELSTTAAVAGWVAAAVHA